MHLECHIGDGFEIPETRARSRRYGVDGIPHVVFDGVINEIGAGLCSAMIGIYSNDVDSSLVATGGISPVEITGEFAIDGNQATVTAHFELRDPGAFTAHQATLFVYEDDVYGEWDAVARMARSTPVSLTQVGQIETVVEILDISGMNPGNLHPVAIYEEIGGTKAVIQASDFIPRDYLLDFPTRVASVPEENGPAYFIGSVTNIGEVADVVDLSVDGGFGWPADFQIEGDPGYYQNHSLPLAVGESKGITVRVRTDGDKRIGSGSFGAVSQNTGHLTEIPLRVFNGSFAILLVNDDNNTGYEAPFVDALNDLGYLFDTAAGEADIGAMRGFDAVIWQTAYQTSTISFLDVDAMAGYLDTGGRLFLSSMDFLSSVSPPNDFVTGYLGVAGWTVNTRSSLAVGVGDDPITDGMNIALDWPSPVANRVDTVNPATGASAIFHSDTNHPIAVRFEHERGFRTVFSTVCQDAIPTGEPYPNNSETVIGRTLEWLLRQDPTAVKGPFETFPCPIVQVGPNPSRGPVAIRFALNDAGAGDTRLTVVDAAGRQVRSLVQGSMQPAAHQVVWDRLDDDGRPVEAGLYFVRLRTAEGVSSRKVVVLK